jgi:hypothetical protein
LTRRNKNSRINPYQYITYDIFIICTCTLLHTHTHFMSICSHLVRASGKRRNIVIFMSKVIIFNAAPFRVAFSPFWLLLPFLADFYQIPLCNITHTHTHTHRSPSLKRRAKKARCFGRCQRSISKFMARLHLRKQILSPQRILAFIISITDRLMSLPFHSVYAIKRK